MDAKATAEAISSLARGLREEYVFADVGDEVAKMLEERNARGEYHSVTSARAFCDLLTKQMSEIAHDKHLRFVYSSQVLPPVPVSKPGEPPAYPDNLPQLRASNFYFEKVERLSGNVGYLKLNAFVYAEGGGAVAAGAMAFLANTDALIIDLRQNDGGEPSMLALLSSYFFDGPVHLNDLAFRIAGTKDYNVKQMWTLPYVPGQRYVDKEVYVLTSQRTFSAAEEFAYDLQGLRRATIVGETTAGGANPGGPYRIGDHFYAAMPMGHSVNPVTKTNWEGKGIAPDIKVPEKDALSTAQRLALQHLVGKTTDQQVLAALKQALAKLDTSR
jgi:C-terminal processing protease CtpA/Prc